MNRKNKPKLIIIAFILTLTLSTLITSRNNKKRLIQELQKSNKELEQQLEDVRRQYQNMYEALIKLEDKK